MSARPLLGIVDDDPSVRESVPDLLGTFGLSSLAYSSGEELLGSGALESIDCLLLDIAMPGMSGPELHRELRRQRRDIPVIFITAQTCGAQRQSVLDEGAVACLRKPFHPDALLGAIRTALDLP